MTSRPDYLINGVESRLFPVLAETSKERRVASIFLAVMTQIPAMAEEVLGSVGVRVGKRTKIQTFTEVVFKDKTLSNSRPDGLIVVDTGRAIWTAIVEAKIGKGELENDQVQRYIEIARSQGIDAVITISNQFVTKAEHSPVNVPKTLLRKVSLFHWSWTWLATICDVLTYKEKVVTPEQSYLLKQLNEFLAHPATGVERFTQMAAPWKDVVQAVSNDVQLKKTSPEVEEVTASWISEEKDLCLHLSSHVGRQVQAVIERKLQDDANARLKRHIESLIATNQLCCTLRVPDCASDIEICADLARKTITCSMSVKAPGDRKSTKARLNWLLKMLGDEAEQLHVKAHWPGRGAPTMKQVKLLREDPTKIQADNPDIVPHTFEVLIVESTGKRFSGRKTFIEDLERIVPTYYDLVGVKLKAWQAPPPKPVKSRNLPDPGDLTLQDLDENGEIPTETP